MRKQITLVLPLVLILQIAATLAHRWASADLPSPQNDPGGVCGRGTVKSSVCDPDGYISQSDADTIDGLINFVNEGSHGFNKLPCKHEGDERGAQLAVAVVGRMDSAFGSKEGRAFRFAKDLHDRWGVGDAVCQNGVVLFFAIKDRAIGISIGAGLRSVFTDKMVPNVMAIMRPKLRKGEYGQGIVDGVVTIGNILSTGEAPSVPDRDRISGLGLLAVVLGVLGVSTVVRMRKNRRYARCKKLLQNIDSERAAASRNEFVATSCPICLEDFQQAEELERSVPVVRRTGSGISVNPSSQNGSASSTTTTATMLDDSSVKTLACGHKFHENCIVSWVSGAGVSNQLCPICRQPITEGAAEATGIADMTNSGQPSGWDVYDPEYSFRVRRARHFYSDFITWNMINSWESDRFNHSCPMATSSVFTAVDPVVVAAAARTSGGGGSSFSFGGGSSSGGGGGGGGW